MTVAGCASPVAGMVEAPGQYAAPVWSIRGDPMALTPADVHNVAFKKPSIGKRGYDEDEVDAFLDLVEAELTRLIEENNDLKAQVEDMQRRGPPGPGRPVPPPEQMPPPPPPVQSRIDENQVVKVLAMAQETAEKYLADAKTEADRMVGQGGRRPDDRRGAEQGRRDDGRGAHPVRGGRAGGARQGERAHPGGRAQAQRDHRRPGAAQDHAGEADRGAAHVRAGVPDQAEVLPGVAAARPAGSWLGRAGNRGCRSGRLCRRLRHARRLGRRSRDE